MRRPRTPLLLSLVAVIAVVALAACSSDDKTSSSTTKPTVAAGSGSTTAAKAIVVSGDNASLGKIVVNDEGKTVYTLTDGAGKAVACTGPCLTAWPPVLVTGGASATGSGGVTKVATVTMADGTQVTIGGLPVYTFAGDPATGAANGDGLASFGGTWHVVKVSGAATGAGTTQTTKPDTSTTSAYGY